MAEIISQRRRLQGEVIADKMSKTVVVKVNRMKVHAKYKKRYVVSSKFKAHDEKGEYHTGDKVIIEETRPISKDKRWRVVNKV